MNILHLTCPLCQKLMAVNPSLLGKNVRCPHCRQVVATQAPAPDAVVPPQVPAAPISAPAPVVPPAAGPLVAAERGVESADDSPTFALRPKPAESHDSIFGERLDDDVFGSRQPRPELPAESPADPPVELEVAPLTAAMEELTPTLFTPDAPLISPEPPEPSVPEGPPTESTPFAVVPEKSQAPTARRPTTPAPSGGVGVMTWLLLGWAIVATGAAIYFSTAKAYLHPFEAIPDVYGEYDKADRKKLTSKLLPPENESVPLAQRVPLGGRLSMHQLEIRPTRIDAGRFQYFTLQANSRSALKATPEIFCLRMRLKNLSADLTFHPIDPAFNRAKLNSDRSPLYNRISLGSAVMPGGLFPWRPEEAGKVRDLLEGQAQDPLPLGPGEERDYLLPSQPVQDVDRLLANHAGELGLWRVQLRTGRVTAGASPPREVAITSVVGVEFRPTEIQLIR